MSNSLDVLRVAEPEKKTELDKFTYRSWWCRTFHDKYIFIVGYNHKKSEIPEPIKVCRICLLDKMF